MHSNIRKKKCLSKKGAHVEMGYWTVKEAAEHWGVSVRMVNYYLNNGRIPTAIRKTGGWLIPENTPQPVDRRKAENKGLQTLVQEVAKENVAAEAMEEIPKRTTKAYMPLLAHPCPNGFEALEAQLIDVEERTMAKAMWHYFRDEHQQSRALSETCLHSESLEIRLTALVLHAMTVIQGGDADVGQDDIERIHQEAEKANTPSAQLYCQVTELLMSVFFHSEGIDLKPAQSIVNILPAGLQYFAMYAMAHALYIQQEYQRAMGVAEAALAMAGNQYPVVSIYLRIVLCMICLSLKQDERANQIFQHAWTIAEQEGYLHPFVEHHGLLQGMVERRLRKSAPAEYERFTQSVYDFSRGWMKIHNPASTSQVTDALTPYEFSIAMLAAKGRSNKEIAQVMDVSVNTVKANLETIFLKLDISSRSQIAAHVNR